MTTRLPVLLAVLLAPTFSILQAAEPTPPTTVANDVDRLIRAELAAAEARVTPLTTDDDFLRRIALDLTGELPSPRDITLFGIDPRPDKRVRVISQLLESPSFATNLARYWRDVIFSRATEVRSRLMLPTFEKWMTTQVNQGRGWDQITRDLLTATGDVRENGATALMFAQGGTAAELAAETSRIFLGIQIQCANCHDHPTDSWKRVQFHQLAAYFPRVRVRPKRDTTPRTFEVVSFNTSPRSRTRPNPLEDLDGLFRRFDRNRDNRLTKAEVARTSMARLFDRVVTRGDTNKDGALSRDEFKQLPRPGGNNRRLETEYFMPDLDNPASQGKKIQPVLFATGRRAGSGLDDVPRRTALANHVTSPTNPWFAKSFVNRVWSELLGEGFTTPIDDMGPGRPVSHPRVLELLSDDFIANGHDIKRLYQVITGTETYQRQIRAHDPNETAPPFASASPTRLRADQVYNALARVLGFSSQSTNRQLTRSGNGTAGMRRGQANRRTLFGLIFGFDPSTPQEDITGTVPQALYLMNSTTLNALIRARGNTRLARILRDFPEDKDAVSEIYLLVLSRDPSKNEQKICREYVAEVGNRSEAFEDLMWSLLNSSEFLSKR